MSDFLRIDEKSNIIDSFSKSVDFLSPTEDLMNLKWFIITFHHGLHGLMLCALCTSGGDGIWEISKKYKLPIYKNLHNSNHKIIDIFNPKNKLLNFKDAYEKIKIVTHMNHLTISKPFVSTSRHDKAISEFNNTLRNKFVHYKPIGESIEENFIYKYTLPLVEIAEFLVFDSGQCMFDLEEQNKLKKSFTYIKDFCNAKLAA